MPITEMTEQETYLPSGGVRTLLREIGSMNEYDNTFIPWTGVLVFTHPQTQKNAKIWMTDGAIYAAHMSGYTPSIALRLKSAGCLTNEEYETVAKLEPSQAGPNAVAELDIPPNIVEEIHREVMFATIAHLYDWMDATWHWEEGKTTTHYITTGVPVLLAASAVDERIGQWNAVVRTRPDVAHPNSVPQPGPAWDSAATTHGATPEFFSVLKKVDGQTTVAQIASTCGFTRFEIAKLLAKASADGILVFGSKNQESIAEHETNSQGTRIPVPSSSMVSSILEDEEDEESPAATDTSAPTNQQLLNELLKTQELLNKIQNRLNEIEEKISK
jgi:hypothetical protein